MGTPARCAGACAYTHTHTYTHARAHEHQHGVLSAVLTQSSLSRGPSRAKKTCTLLCRRTHPPSPHPCNVGVDYARRRTRSASEKNVHFPFSAAVQVPGNIAWGRGVDASTGALGNLRVHVFFARDGKGLSPTWLRIGLRVNRERPWTRGAVHGHGWAGHQVCSPQAPLPMSFPCRRKC